MKTAETVQYVQPNPDAIAEPAAENSDSKKSNKTENLPPQSGQSICRIRAWQLVLLLSFLGKLRIRHYMRLLISVALIAMCVPANVWLFKLVESVSTNAGAATGMVGVNLIDGSNYGLSSRSQILAVNDTDYYAVEETLLARGVKPGVLTRCSTWSDCRREFLIRLHGTMFDSYIQTARLDATGRPVQAECSGGASHALTCAYFLQLLMRPYDNSSTVGPAAFKDVGFLRYVVKGEMSEQYQTRQVSKLPEGLDAVPDTPCTRSNSLGLLSPVSRFHAVLLLTALAAMILLVRLWL